MVVARPASVRAPKGSPKVPHRTVNIDYSQAVAEFSELRTTLQKRREYIFTRFRCGKELFYVLDYREQVVSLVKSGKTFHLIPPLARVKIIPRKNSTGHRVGWTMALSDPHSHDMVEDEAVRLADLPYKK